MDSGYDPSRFIVLPRKEFHCCICLCVIKDPRTCEAGEHYFCFSCIIKHLDNSPTCPECRHPLNSEALKHPQSFFTKYLSKLRIKCDHANRGCPEHVPLGNLQNHASGCGYRPITCQVCGFKISAKDEDIHKTSFCQPGGVNVQGLSDIKLHQEETIDYMKIVMARQRENNEKLDNIMRTLNVIMGSHKNKEQSEPLISRILQLEKTVDSLKRQENNVAISSEENNVANSSEENDVADSSEENGIANSSEENDIANSSEENNIANSSEENDVANSFEENDFANSSEENDIANSSEENNIANSSEENDIANSSEENDFANSFEENGFANSFEENNVANSSEENKAKRRKVITKSNRKYISCMHSLGMVKKF